MAATTTRTTSRRTRNRSNKAEQVLLIVASELDAHADAVIGALRKTGFQDIFRIDCETAQTRFDIKVEPRGGRFTIVSRDDPQRSCRAEDVRTIWWRRANSQIASGKIAATTDGELDASESYWGVRWLVECFPDAVFPLNHPMAIRNAHNKLRQICVADRLGMRTPETIFANRLRHIEEFCADRARIVVKPLAATIVQDSSSGKTVSLVSRAVTSGQVMGAAAREEGFSLYCQEKIDKVSDVRINVFPSATVACRIDTSGLPDGQVDWRKTTFAHRHEIIDVPARIEDFCRQYLKEFGLKWGAFDFGLTAEGAYVFFECNPNGQWLWIELMTGAPLSEIVARDLVAHHDGPALQHSCFDQLAGV